MVENSPLSRRMMSASEASSNRRLMPAVLPWVVAAAALAVYLLTLNHWVSLSSLPWVATVSGWTWQPETSGPLYWLLTVPFRWLPLKTIPLALNLFSAACAALTLGLLARSVALLPHDRSEEQRIREKSDSAVLSIRSAWLPPVLAALVCGLQLTFWENATAASSEMLDLVLFAYVVRCLLEFRVDGRHAWLYRSALVYGAAMANNWGMVGFFPLFLAALIWNKGVGFFNGQFLSRMFLLGLAGLSFYLLLPVVSSLSDTVQVSFWQALKANLTTQKLYLGFIYNKWTLLKGDHPLWVLGLYSLLPVLAFSIRWPSYFGDPSKLGVALATLILHLVSAVMLGVCTWVMLDPQQVSPRNYQPYGLTLLPLYYLAALAVGYFSGYFLLIFGAQPSGRSRSALPSWRPLNLAVTGLIWLLPVVATALLLFLNRDQVRTTNGSLLKDYTALVRRELPAQGGVILSDDTRRLILMQAALTQSGTASQYLFLHTAWLKWPDYHRFLKQKYPQRWSSNPPRERKQFDDRSLMQLVDQLSRSNQVYYLHPSFGYYFEMFYPEPHGLVYKLTSYPTNPPTLLAPVPDKALVEANQQFWTEANAQALDRLAATISPPPKREQPGPLARYMKKARLKKETNREALAVGPLYSAPLNFWGVQLQRLDQLPAAGACFSRAVALDANNRVAEANLECNTSLAAGSRVPELDQKEMEQKLGKFHNFQEAMNEGGPFDEPNFCYVQGLLFPRGGLYRQAAQQFSRVKALAPDHLGARLYLAQLNLMVGLPDEALKLVQEIHAQSQALGLGPTNQTDVVAVEASAYLARKELPQAEAAFKSAFAKAPADEALLATATQVYMNFRLYSNALATIDQRLQLNPNNTNALVNKGFACLQLKAFDQAVEPLTRAIDMETNNFSQLHYSAVLNRAIVYLLSDKLDAAQQDYETLQKAFPTSYPIYYGLGEVAYRKKDTSAAIRNYELYLSNAPTNAPEYQAISQRVKELEQPAKEPAKAPAGP
jgi:tetratricopeptide (TPR) repeat protein